ncbi:probable NADP(H) oxidoreductase [Moritella sp. PE36]|nr:probable NADP(H) oxidoreductase [Moritella sp. PE36]
MIENHMHKILVLFAHPALQKSIAHKSLFNEIQNIEGITCHDLYDTYPDSFIDIKHEQTLLLNHDIIVLQFPLYWYSCPAILKEWQDLVLEHGFAYGEYGDKLVGKKIMLAISTGGSMNSYSTAGYNEHDISQFLLPFSQMSKLCNLEYLTPFVVHDIHKRHDPARIARKAKEYRQLLLTLQQQNDDAVAARQENC